MAKARPTSANLYDFRDLDIMLKIEAESNGKGIPGQELAELMGFDEGENRPMGMRLAWMKHYGMVIYDQNEKLWSLSRSGERVTQAHLRAPALRAVEAMPDVASVELMAHIVSRYQRGQPMLAQMLRREFLYGTKQRRRP